MFYSIFLDSNPTQNMPHGGMISERHRNSEAKGHAMSMFIAMVLGGLGTTFGMRQQRRGTGGGGTPIAGTPTYYIYGF